MYNELYTHTISRKFNPGNKELKYLVSGQTVNSASSIEIGGSLLRRNHGGIAASSRKLFRKAARREIQLARDRCRVALPAGRKGN